MRLALLGCAFSIGCAGCASHAAVHVAPDESRPHITWEMRTGGADGDEQFRCGSQQPGIGCELPASTASSSVRTTVRVFLHAAAAETSYLGVLTLPFLDGIGDGTREVNLTVPRGSRPVSITINTHTTSTPGSYTLNVQLDATMETMPAPVRIVENIPVIVK